MKQVCVRRAKSWPGAQLLNEGESISAASRNYCHINIACLAGYEAKSIL